MKTVAFLFTLFSITISGVSQMVNVNSENEWVKSKKQSLLNKKPIFIDFYTSWCTPCKKMDNTVFKQNSVLNFLNNNFTSLKIDAESPFGKKLKQRYKISAYPTFLYLDNEFEQAAILIGSQEQSMFIEQSKIFLNKCKEIKPLAYYESRYKKGIRDTLFIKSYLKKLLSAGMDSTAKPILEKYINGKSKIELLQTDNIELIATYVHDCKNPYFELVRNTRSQHNLKIELFQLLEQSYKKSLKNCLDEAIKNKNEQTLHTIIDIQLNDPSDLTPEKTTMETRLKFYKRTKQDSLYYFWVSAYMNKWVKMDTVHFQENANIAFNKMYKNTNEINRAKFIQKWVAGEKNSFSGDLNYFSRMVLDEIKDKSILINALEWSKHACELNPVPDYFDTLAHILFKLGKKQEAIEQQKKRCNWQFRQMKIKSHLKMS